MRSLTLLLFALLLLFLHSSLLLACSTGTCSLREYLEGLKGEKAELECTKTKFDIVINLVTQANNTKILKIRTEHRNKVVNAIQILESEIQVLDAKCSTFQGPLCDGCPVGYYGTNCSETTCFGISSNSSFSCSSRGKCTGYNTCTCNEPFYGANCENGTSTISNFGSYMAYQDGRLGKTCLSYYKSGATLSGNYRIQPSTDYPPLDAYCEIASPLLGKKGWTSLYRYNVAGITGIKDFTPFSEVYLTITDGTELIFTRTSPGIENTWTSKRIRYVGTGSSDHVTTHFIADNSKGVEEDLGAYCGTWKATGHFATYNYQNEYTIGARLYMDCSSSYNGHYREARSITPLKYISSNSYGCSTCNGIGNIFLY